ncbi:MAG: protein-L-isoaspartate(D-aspartate) O-methyltransferase [Bacteriovoracaceae bacterium]|nr:protein-L-isoaspartate(D-aspartate) O-methyltransferase [Bacteriovoracaceae bacterium]
MTTKREMIEEHIMRRGIKDESVLNALREIDRKDFIPEPMKPYAYEDGPLPIGKNQTISQPYIVAFMAEALKLTKESKVLEVGSGCGYNAAVLSRLASKVYSIEIIEWLAEKAQNNIEKLNLENVHIKFGDGYKGWPDKGPFDAIIITAAPSTIPEPLKEQLKIGGKLLAPVGTIRQELILLEKVAHRKYRQKNLMPVRFVPMTGIAQESNIPPEDSPDATDTY